MKNSILDFGTRCPECGRGQRLCFDLDGEGVCLDCTRWTVCPNDEDELVDLAAWARDDFGDNQDDGVRIPLPPLCWNCNAARPGSDNPCPACGADAVPF